MSNLNFELKDKYETPLQKISIFIMYVIGYLAVVVVATVALPASFFNIVGGIDIIFTFLITQKMLPVPISFIFTYSYEVLLIFTIVNMFLINYFSKKDPYKINKSFISFLIVNFLILAPLCLVINIFNYINYVLSALFVFNGFQVILLMIYYRTKNLIPIQKQTELPSINRTKPNIPVDYIICPNCNTNIRPDIAICPICHYKIVR